MLLRANSHLVPLRCMLLSLSCPSLFVALSYFHVVFVFWSTVALALSFGHGVVYAASSFVPRNSAWDLLLPVTSNFRSGT